MCGVSGILHFGRADPVTNENLLRMNQQLIHRGPDGSGIYISENSRIGLGHRRLSIIDLSENGFPDSLSIYKINLTNYQKENK